MLPLSELFEIFENYAWFFWLGVALSKNGDSILGYIALALVIVLLGAKHIARRIEKKKNG